VKYVYAALLLHSSAQPVTEENVKKVVIAAGGQAEEAQVKALVAALSEVNIDEAEIGKCYGRASSRTGSTHRGKERR